MKHCLSCLIYYFYLGATLFPEDIKVINTSYNYVDIRWKNTRPHYFFYGSLRGYIVTLEKMGDSSENGTSIFTNCHSEGINITNLEEHTTYCVYVAAFTQYGKGNSTSCMVAVTGERGRFEIWFSLEPRCPVIWKPINGNPGLKVNWGFNLSCIKLSFNANVL